MNRDDVAKGRAERLTEGDRRLYESFRSLGMSPAAALSATAGRGGSLSSSDPVERMAESFEGLGLSPDGARIAAVGRRESEYGLREALSASDEQDDANRPTGGSGADTADGQRLLDLMDEGHSVSEAQAIIERGGSAPRREASGSRHRVKLAERVATLERERGLPFLDALHEAEREMRTGAA